MRQSSSPIFILALILLLLSLGLFGFGLFLHTVPPKVLEKTAAVTPGHTKAEGAAKKHTKPAVKSLPSPSGPDNAGDTFLIGGGFGFFLAALCGLVAARQRPVAAPPPAATSMRSDQSVAWEKQRQEMDAQRQQLQLQLQEAQKSKAEMDSLRQKSSKQFQEFFRTLPVACFCFAADGKIVRWNAACEALYGVSTADALERTLWETLVPPMGREVMEAWISRVLAGESLLDVERMDRQADGTTLLVRSSMVPLLDVSGGIIGGLSASLNVSSIRQQEGRTADLSATLQETLTALDMQRQEVARLTADLDAAQRAAAQVVPAETPHTELEIERDMITGLCGREAFQERLRIETERAGRYHTSLSVILMDLDGFADYNQRVTTLAGDAALKSVAALLESKLRTVDVAARYGADEFALILPETGQAGAGVAVERLRSGLRAIAWPEQPLTACFGVVVLTPDISAPEQLAARATDALRCARSLGANTIVQHSEMPTSPPAKKPRAPRTKKAEASVSA